jgi:DNA polymerase-1
MSQLLLDRRHHGLKELSRDILDDSFDEADEIKKLCKKLKINMGQLMELPEHDPMILRYAIRDAENTYAMYQWFSRLMDKREMWPVFYKEMRLMRRVIFGMESRGMPVNSKTLLELRTEAKEKADSLLDKMRKLTADDKFNPNSLKQVCKYVFPTTEEDLTEHKRVFLETGSKLETAVPTHFTKGSSPRVDKFTLKKSGTALGKLVLRYKQLRNAESRYIKNLLELADATGVVHPSLSQNGARTGRAACRNPNLQNLPTAGKSVLNRIRSAFVPRPGYRFVMLDYDQIELRLAAHFSEQPYMLDAILNGKDLHTESAIRYFDVQPGVEHFKQMRKVAKVLNFAMLYGCGSYKLSEIILSQADIFIRPKECRSYIQTYWGTNRKLAEFKAKLEEKVGEDGGVTNPFGRFIPLNHRYAYKAVNTLIQSTAADILKRAMLLCADRIADEDVWLLMQIHDELLFELPKTKVAVVCDLHQLMEVLDLFRVPLTVSTQWGPDWYNKQPLNLRRIRAKLGQSIN